MAPNDTDHASIEAPSSPTDHAAGEGTAPPDAAISTDSGADDAPSAAPAKKTRSRSTKKTARKKSTRKTTKATARKKTTSRRSKSKAAADDAEAVSDDAPVDSDPGDSAGVDDAATDGTNADGDRDADAGDDGESGESTGRKRSRSRRKKTTSTSSPRSSSSREPAKVVDNTPLPREVMVVNELPGEECRIAILADNHLEELFAERVDTATSVGNIYKGRVTNVEPAIQAAFVDYGQGVSGFLHISDLHPKYFPGADQTENVGRKIPRRDRPPIQHALRRGSEILVQVLKEGIGTKGPTLTSYLSIPGRLLVMMPEMGRVGVSRKVEDEDQRREMRRVLDDIDLPESFGFILRTAGIGQTKTEIKRDVAYLTRLWKVMEKRIQSVGAPCLLYGESDLLIRTVRDVLRPSIEAIVVDSDSSYDRVCTFLSVIAPRSAPKVIHYQRSTPLFHAYDVERQIDLIHARSVPLPSGGHLVIDQTEALVAIDVNSGKSRGARDSETNAYQTNCEAVDEIARQLRLRDLGGLIVNDLIDMRSQRHRRQVKDRFLALLKRDRAKTTVLSISDLGLMEMTRQRMRPSLRKAHFVDCPHCDGHGEIKSPESVAGDAVRQAGYVLAHAAVRRVELVCSPRVASVLLSRKRRTLVRIEDETEKRVDVRVSDDIPVDRVDVYAYDDRNADIDVTRLPVSKPPSIDILERESAAAADAPAAEAEAPGEPRSGRRRRRRRRKPEAADATAIAMAGGFDIDEEDDDDDMIEDVSAPLVSVNGSEDDGADGEPRPKRRRRRRRRRGGGGGGEAETARDDTAATAETPQPDATDTASNAKVRVHVLAKEIGVKSREILDHCAELGVEVANHMSSITAETAAAIRVALGGAPAESAAQPAESATSDGDAGAEQPRKRRRRRGGRGRRGRGGDAPQAGDSTGEDKDTAPTIDVVTDSPGDEPAETKRPKRRTLYRNRGRVAATAREGVEADRA